VDVGRNEADGARPPGAVAIISDDTVEPKTRASGLLGRKRNRSPNDVLARTARQSDRQTAKAAEPEPDATQAAPRRVEPTRIEKSHDRRLRIAKLVAKVHGKRKKAKPLPTEELPAVPAVPTVPPAPHAAAAEPVVDPPPPPTPGPAEAASTEGEEPAISAAASATDTTASPVPCVTVVEPVVDAPLSPPASAPAEAAAPAPVPCVTVVEPVVDAPLSPPESAPAEAAAPASKEPTISAPVSPTPTAPVRRSRATGKRQRPEDSDDRVPKPGPAPDTGVRGSKPTESPSPLSPASPSPAQRGRTESDRTGSSPAATPPKTSRKRQRDCTYYLPRRDTSYTASDVKKLL
jgi:hypothetical protein